MRAGAKPVKVCQSCQAGKVVERCWSEYRIQRTALSSTALSMSASQGCWQTFLQLHSTDGLTTDEESRISAIVWTKPIYSRYTVNTQSNVSWLTPTKTQLSRIHSVHDGRRISAWWISPSLYNLHSAIQRPPGTGGVTSVVSAAWMELIRDGSKPHLVVDDFVRQEVFL